MVTDVDFYIDYRGRSFHIVKVDASYDRFCLITELTLDNKDVFLDAVDNRYDCGVCRDYLYKETCGGMRGLAPALVWNDASVTFGKFKLDTWLPDDNKKLYESSKTA